jgi:type IV pilus assembly protein PilB
MMSIPSETPPIPTVDYGIAKLVERLLAKAIDDGATALTIELYREGTRVRYRRQGRWQMVVPLLAKVALESIGLYLRELANFPTTNGICTGTFEKVREGQTHQLTLKIFPTASGDQIGIAIQPTQRPAPSLEKIITDANTFNRFQRLLDAERGLFLIIGSEDSGKSATIASILAVKADENKNVWWLAKSAQYAIDGVAVLSTTTSETLQACLEQTPDILAIDPLTDGETARQLFQLASNRLVLVSMVADSLGNAFQQLLDWGISVDRLASNLLGVLQQKLLNSLCHQCRLSDRPSLEEFNRLGLARPRSGEYFRSNSLSFEQCEEQRRTHQLCKVCYGSGYQNRVAIQALLPMQSQLKALLQRQSDSEEIDLAMRESGISTLLDRAWQLASAGQISLLEVQQCLRPGSFGQMENWDDDQVMAMEFGQVSGRVVNDGHLQAEMTALQQKYQQAMSELESRQEQAETFEQRLWQSRQQAEQSTKIEIALQLISIIDIVELARNSIRPQSDREAAIQKGYSMLENKLLSTLRDMGVRSIEAQGRPFDSRWHEVAEEEVNQSLSGHVLAELKRGFMLGDRVLRLAQVRVAVSSSYL